MQRSLLFVLLAGFALACSTTSSRTPDVSAAPDADAKLRAAFAEADTDSDGFVDFREFHARIIEIYFHADTDKDGFTSPQELDAVTIVEEDFDEIDTNEDNVVTIHEFTRRRVEVFVDVDDDEDGRLSLAELLDAGIEEWGDD